MKNVRDQLIKHGLFVNVVIINVALIKQQETEEKLRNEPTQLSPFGIGKAIETAEKQHYDGISRVYSARNPFSIIKS